MSGIEFAILTVELSNESDNFRKRNFIELG
jgi:hypothetical protein